MKLYGHGAYPYLTVANRQYGGGPIGGGAGYLYKDGASGILTPSAVAAIVASTGKTMWTASDVASFKDACLNGTAGDYVYIANDIEFHSADLPWQNAPSYAQLENSGIYVPAGMTFFGTRGIGGSLGPRLAVMDTVHAYADNSPVFLTVHAGCRFTGLRIAGPNQTFMSTVGAEGRWIGLSDFGWGGGVELDNCEVYGWPDRAMNAFDWLIHHNNIHHNAGAYEGYGVAVDHAGACRVFANKFDYCRHAISSGGIHGVGGQYRVYFNLFGPQNGMGGTSVIDVHGGNDAQLTGAPNDLHFEGHTISLTKWVVSNQRWTDFAVGDRIYTSAPVNKGPFTIVSISTYSVTVAESLVTETPADYTDIFNADLPAGDDLELAWNTFQNVNHTNETIGIRGYPQAMFTAHHNWFKTVEDIEMFLVCQNLRNIGGTYPNPWKSSPDYHVQADDMTGTENPNWISQAEPPDVTSDAWVVISTTPAQPENCYCHVDGVNVGSTATQNPLPSYPVEAIADHEITFDPINGQYQGKFWTTPNPVQVNVLPGETQQVTGEYSSVPTGTLIIQAVDEAGQQVPASIYISLQGSGITDFIGNGAATVNKPPGRYVVTFEPVMGHQTPAAWSVLVTAGTTQTYIASYALTGAMVSVSVTGLPSTEIVPVFLDGGTSPVGTVAVGSLLEFAVPAGNHVISFAPVAGYYTPAMISFTAVSGQSYPLAGTYSPIGSTGTITVYTQPIEAPVYLDYGNGPVLLGTTKYLAGQTLAALIVTVNAGTSYTISFGSVTGYDTPQAQDVSVSGGQNVSVTGQYVANGEPPVIPPGEAKSRTAVYAAAGALGLLVLLAALAKRRR